MLGQSLASAAHPGWQLINLEGPQRPRPLSFYAKYFCKYTYCCLILTAVAAPSKAHASHIRLGTAGIHHVPPITAAICLRYLCADRVLCFVGQRQTREMPSMAGRSHGVVNPVQFELCIACRGLDPNCPQE